MVLKEHINLELRRIRILLFLILGLLAVLCGALFVIQVGRGPEYEKSLRKQSMRRIRLPAPRGRIFDRNATCLADNQPSYGVALYLEELRRPGKWSNTVTEVKQTLDTLTVVLRRKPVITEDDIWLHIRKRLPLPLVAWRNLDPDALARLAESPLKVEGVDICAEPQRGYPKKELAAHVLGYVGKAEISDDDSDYQYFLPEMEGRSGIERVFNDWMSGEAGGELVRIDASGFKHAEGKEREPKPGRDVVLALDAHLQTLAEAAIRDTSGAAVILDPSNGDVLAMASSPTFDPNEFVPVLSPEVWQEKLQDPGKPLNNRAAMEVYAPGSIFKPVTALAALTSGRCTEGTAFTCNGVLNLGKIRLRCWNPNGHGTISLRKAIEQSCNVYFASLGTQCGYEAIHDMAVNLGLGEKTGIELDHEARGLVPDDAWKMKTYQDKWRNGDTCNVSIGQGALTVTPLQMAVVAATIANGGDLYRPRLVLRVKDRQGNVLTNYPPKLVRHVPWTQAAIAVVRAGMHDVVMAETGTGGRARIANVEMAGKTGTAEFGEKGEGHKHGWMIVFAPFDRPRYAVAMVVDEAVSGGTTVGPRIHNLMDAVFNGSGTGG